MKKGSRLKFVPGFVRSIALDESVRAAWFPFLLTRAIFLIALLLVSNLTLLEPSFGGGVQEPEITLQSAGEANRVRSIIQSSDANWYVDIAREGYERRPFDNAEQHHWAFFPLYPIVLSIVARLTGEFPLTGAVLSSLFFFFALVIFHKLCLAFGLEAPAAGRALFYISAFPTSYFFSLPVTESLFLLLTAGSFLAAKRERWWVAAALGALASATRLNGVVLLPALALLYWRSGRRIRFNFLSLLLIPAGLLVFMLHLRSLTGNALAFVEAQAAWGRATGLFFYPLYEYVRNYYLVASPWNFRLLNFAAAILALVCGAVLLKRREWALAAYCLVQVIIPLSSTTLMGMSRYVMITFPVFMVLAYAGNRERVDQTIRAIFIALFTLLAVLYAAHFSIAMV